MSYSPPPTYQGSNAANSNGGEPPLEQPYYGAPIGAAVRRIFKKYATFSGRASRSEFWWWFLVAGILGVMFNILTSALRSPSAPATQIYFTSPGQSVVEVIQILFALAVLVPGLAVTWRRLHDTGRSGGWYFLTFVPLVGGIIVIVFLASASKPEGQRFDR
jgi:uncharacterized membrane protein YhaH (DUF805 family)